MNAKGIDFIGVGVGAVLIEDEKVLLLERLRNPEAGFWSIPGGSVDFGERLEDAIVRELREELSIEARVTSLLGISNHIIQNDVQIIHWVAPIFAVEIAKGCPVNVEPHKHREVRWFSIENLPRNITLTTQDAFKFLAQRIQ